MRCIIEPSEYLFLKPPKLLKKLMVLGLANLWWVRLPKKASDERLLCICSELYFLTEKLEAAGEVNGEYEAEEGGHGHAAPWRHSGRVRTAPGCRLLLDQTEIRWPAEPVVT